MEQLDQKKLDMAITYLQRIADGNNPVNNMPAEEDSVLNNPNVIRCMYFVKEVLEEVRRNGGFIGSKPRKSQKAAFPPEALSAFVYQEDKAISKIVAQINEKVDDTVYQKLSYKPIVQWLKKNGFLTEEVNRGSGKTQTMPTEKGIQIGIRAEKRVSFNGAEYFLVLYDQQAQEFLVQNMEMILRGDADL
ncbi:MAG: hypothetical protein LUD14_08010 [Clostridiales bacterium]|nr:hypothetical protein [Clostridiales bacterium]